jgi:pectate lyase
MNNNKNLGNITLLIDCFLRHDKKNKLLTFKNLKIIKRNNINIIQEIAIQKNNQMRIEHNNTFDDIQINNSPKNIIVDPKTCKSNKSNKTGTDRNIGIDNKNTNRFSTLNKSTLKPEKINEITKNENELENLREEIRDLEVKLENSWSPA